MSSHFRKLCRHRCHDLLDDGKAKYFFLLVFLFSFLVCKRRLKNPKLGSHDHIALLRLHKNATPFTEKLPLAGTELTTSQLQAPYPPNLVPNLNVGNIITYSMKNIIRMNP